MAPSGERVSPFDWNSSPVDWCEHNYVVTPLIAEFWNTVTCLLYFVYPPLLIWLFRGYAARAGWGCHLVWGLLMVVGASGVWFHGTLSLAGQLLDEFSIIWVVGAAIGLWIPQHFKPAFISDRKAFQSVMLAITILGTVLGVLNPYINSLIMMTLSFPVAYVSYTEVKRCEDPFAKRLGSRAVVLWALAVLIWISDRALCGVWRKLNFPYGHAIWHVLIVVASYWAVIFFAYIDSQVQHARWRPRLQYWPSDTWTWLGVPHIVFTEAHKTSQRKAKRHQ